MKKYRNNSNGKIATIVCDMAAGMCRRTLGLTMIVYKYDIDNHDFMLVMQSVDFYKNHTEV